jgi:hypothetical protein
MYYALFYDLVDDVVNKRAPYREQHLGLAQKAYEDGLLVLAGALADPPDRALLVFRADDASVVEEFARNDPYVINGIVTDWQVRKWTVVIPNQR